MKNRILLMMLTALSTLPLFTHATQDRTSQTFMFPRPLYHNLAALSAAWSSVIAQKKGDHCFAGQFVPIYQRSINDWCPIKKYFLLNCKPQVTVIGDTVSTANDPAKIVNRDIRAEWLGLPSDFEGVLTICPEQRQVGGIIQFNQSLAPFIDWEFLANWWVDLAIPIFNVRNKLNTTGSSQAVLDALKRNDLLFARLISCEREKTGLGEISLTFGSNFLNKNGFLLSYYTGIGIPAERNPLPEILFPTTLGNHGHLVVIAGGHLKMPVIEYDEYCNLRFYLDIENRYYVANHQCRTFDLKNKQWSRYMPVHLEGVAKTIPAANVLTQHVKVNPHSFTQLSTGLEWTACDWHFEAGYHLWTHPSEQIEFRKLDCDKIERSFTRYGLADATGTATANASSSMSTIAIRAANDTTFTTIKETDIDLTSGSGRGATVHRLHGALYRYNNNQEDSTMFFGLGAFYDAPSDNTAFKGWGVWLKAGQEF